MTLWQRRARLGLAIIGLTVAVLVFLAIRKGEAPPAAAAGVKRVDPSAVIESTKGVLTQAKSAEESFKVEFQRQLTYEGGNSKLMGVTIRVPQRAGRSFIVTGREAKVGDDQGTVELIGKVKMTASDGLVVLANQASYNNSEGMVRAQGRVSFERGGLTGSGIGMTYDKTHDILSLLQNATVDMAPGGRAGSGVNVQAGTIVFARADRYMRFEGDVKIAREGRRASADNAIAYLGEDDMQLTALELRGNAHINEKGGGEGTLQTMIASDMNLAYSENGQLLQHVTLAGSGAVQMAGAPGGRGTRVQGEALDIGFAPDGTTVTALNARDKVETNFAATKGTATRVVRSNALECIGEDEHGLNAARFTENVEYVETLPGKPPVKRTVRARSLESVLKPGMASLEDARFAGSVKFEEGELKGSAATIRYRLDAGVVSLAGNEGTTRPRMIDEQITVDADEIELTLEGRKMNATRDVRSVIQPADQTTSTGATASKRTDAPKMPGMLNQKQPVNVTANALAYDESASHAVYTGNARLWQAETTIVGNTITLDDKSGDLTAIGAVRSTWMTQETNAETKEVEKVPTVGTAAELHYEEALHRATYTTNAHVVGTQGDLTGKKIELYMKPGESDANELEKVEAYEAVTVHLDLRVGTGERLTYFAADQRYLMTGPLVKIVEECRVTTGRTLTFFKATDRIIVDGNEQRRTQTTSESSNNTTTGDCKPPPSH